MFSDNNIQNLEIMLANLYHVACYTVLTLCYVCHISVSVILVFSKMEQLIACARAKQLLHVKHSACVQFMFLKLV